MTTFHLMKPAISVRNLGKLYRIGVYGARSYRTLRDTISEAVRAPLRRLRPRSASIEDANSVDTIWALKDVSFEVQTGEVIGIIGRNGAGKSTLLKVLSQITEPTTGRVELRGRVGSLLEVGTGFHPELTGRENIALNGAILGMTAREIARKFDDIVAFAELSQFIDTPVKRYSSGMYTRLAFAVAAFLEAEILLIDEVLAVGDAGFQRRCLRKMDELSRSGRTVFFVSHDLGAIRSLCSKAILFDKGKLIEQGNADVLVSKYLSRLADLAQAALKERKDRSGNGAARLTEMIFTDAQGRAMEAALCGQEITIQMGYTSMSPGSKVEVELTAYTSQGHKLFHLSNKIRGIELPPLQDAGRFRCRLPRLSLAPGSYRINALLLVDNEVADHLDAAGVLEVLPGDYYQTGKVASTGGGLVFLDHDWN